jgi:hypothetical protein
MGHKNALNIRFNKNKIKFVKGHYKYGVHLIMGIKNPIYLTMLRDPVERCISYYYFIINSKSERYEHPHFKEADSKTLVEFFENRRFRNQQASFISGVPFSSMGNHFGAWSCVLSRAKYNIKNNYLAFGLQERFKESAQLFASKLGVEVKPLDKRYKSVSSRPTKEDLSKQMISRLKELNRVDIELYRFAKRRFDVQ